MLNDVTLIGRFTADPELKATPNGTHVVRFRLACDRGFEDKEGNKADFIPVSVWGRSAENVSLYCKKGSLVAVKGAIRTGKYDKDGITHYTMEVVANRVSFLSFNNNDNQFENNDDFFDGGTIPNFDE